MYEDGFVQLTSLHADETRPLIEYCRVQQTRDEAADEQYGIGPRV